MMDLDEAIKHAEEVAEQNEAIYAEHCKMQAKSESKFKYEPKCKKCAEEHRQLAEWLKELKELRELKTLYTDGLKAYKEWKTIYADGSIILMKKDNGKGE